MSDLLIGIIAMVLLYSMGRFLYPESQHVPIQQELIKMNDKDYLYGVKYNLEEEE